MFHHVESEGFGWLASLGLGWVILTEVVIRALGGGAILVPHSWWLLSGYAVAAAYCALLHLTLALREKRCRGQGLLPSYHTLMRMPLAVWSILYLLLGLLRVSAPK
jgi:hypothetical protein